MARFAAIDIGSNAMRLRIVEAHRPVLAGTSNNWQELCSLRAPVRLGREVFLTGSLTSVAISAAADALKQFREAMDQHKVDHYRAVATSAMREATNAEVLVERAYREAGVHVEVIEGIEEARLVQLAVRRRLPLDGQSALLIDIGGGSTELTLLDHGEARASQSLPLGTVRLLEAFLEKEVAVDARHEELVAEFVERVLSEMSTELRSARPDVMIATGGNTETLAQVCPRKVAGWPGIDVERMESLACELSAMSAAERMRRYELRADRADTIIPAARILLHVAKAHGQEGVMVPGVGLKDGLLEELVDKHFVCRNLGAEEGAITHACLQLGRRYHFDEKHGLLVAGFATQLFDDLRELHRLGERERLLLKAAALLHDVGDFIRYEGHHKHSFYIIEHSDLMGITPSERRVVANIARYHRKSHPDVSHPNFRELGREERSTVRTLASLLRLADALDREHRGKVTGVTGTVSRGRLKLEVTGAPERALELWTVARKSELFKEVFDLNVEVVEAPPGSRRAPSSAALRARPLSITARGAFLLDLRAMGASTVALLAMPTSPRRPCPPLALLLCALVSALLGGCGKQAMPDPRATLDAYQKAAEAGDAEAIHALLTERSQRLLGREGVQRAVSDGHAELAEQAKQLAATASPKIESVARVRYGDGEQATLVLEDGGFRVSSADALPAGARTPSQALEQLRRVLARRSYAGLMRVLSKETRLAVERDIAALVEGLERPEGLEVKTQGDRAVVQVPGGHQVRLLRESGVWTVEDFD